MVAAISVVFQFILMGELIWTHSLIFGALALVAAYVGIKGVNVYIRKSGRQSVIAIMLVIVLILALVSLPINLLLSKI